MSRKAGILGVVVGFVAVGGGFGMAAVAALRAPPAPVFAQSAPEAVPDAAPDAGPEGAPDAGLGPDGMLVYVQIEEQLAVAVAEQPVRVMLRLAVAVRGSPAALLELKGRVDAAMPSILAAALTAAQLEVAQTVDPVALMQRLPGPLRVAVNGVVGTAELPEPVVEVLVTGLVTQ